VTLPRSHTWGDSNCSSLASNSLYASRSPAAATPAPPRNNPAATIRYRKRMPPSPLPAELRLQVDLSTLLGEFLGLLLHALLESLLRRDPLLLRVLAHVLRDFHGAEMRAAH